MAKKKNIIPAENSVVLSAKSKVDALLDKKHEALIELSNIGKSFNELADLNVKSSEEWINALPIENIHDLNDNTRISKLDKIKKRKSLKKSSIELLNRVDELENQIRIAYIDFIAAKIENVLNDKKEIV